MTNLPAFEPESSGLLKVANDILHRRRLRPRFFDNQFFGEQSWELLLHLFVLPKGSSTVSEAAAALKVSGSATMAMARVLVAQGLVVQGDSDGAWDEIPLGLTAVARQRLRSYLAELIETRLVAA